MWNWESYVYSTQSAETEHEQNWVFSSKLRLIRAGSMQFWPTVSHSASLLHQKRKYSLATMDICINTRNFTSFSKLDFLETKGLGNDYTPKISTL